MFSSFYFVASKKWEKIVDFIFLVKWKNKEKSPNHYSICYSHKLSMFKSLIELAYNMSSAFNS